MFTKNKSFNINLFSQNKIRNELLDFLMLESLVGHTSKKKLELVLKPELLNIKDNDGNTPLMIAIKKRNSAESIQMMIGAGCRVNIQNSDGYTALMFAVMNCVDWNDDSNDRFNYEMVVELLILSGCDLDICNNEGKTALHLIVQKPTPRNVAIVKLLVDAKCDLDKKDNNGSTALMVINDENFNTRSSICKIMKILIDNGCNLNVVNNNGYTIISLMLTGQICQIVDDYSWTILKMILLAGANDEPYHEQILQFIRTIYPISEYKFCDVIDNLEKYSLPRFFSDSILKNIYDDVFRIKKSAAAIKKKCKYS